MPRYVAFLRGMNLGKRRVTMSRLRELFHELSFGDVATFIASGNVLFSSEESHRDRLEARIRQHLQKSLGYDVETFVRTAEEVTAIGKVRIFPDQDRPGVTIHVGFLHAPLPAEVARRLAALRTPEDEFRVKGTEYYWLCRVRTSESRVWAGQAMKALRLPSSSMRNLTGIRKLIAKHLA